MFLGSCSIERVVDRGVRRWSRVRCPTTASRWSAGRRRALRHWASAPEAATPGNRGPAVARGGPRLWVRQPAAIRRWRLPALHRLLREGRKKGNGGPARAPEFKARVREALDDAAWQTKAATVPREAAPAMAHDPGTIRWLAAGRSFPSGPTGDDKAPRLHPYVSITSSSRSAANRARLVRIGTPASSTSMLSTISSGRPSAIRSGAASAASAMAAVTCVLLRA
jgi:hypothetical protein